MSPSYLKTSIDGVNGSGKTCTVAQLALGLAKEYGDGKPVHVYDSSDRWAAWKRLMFDVERVPLVITYGRSIAALQESIDRAAEDGCSVFVGDDLTVPWVEAVQAFSFENGNLPFDRRQQLMNLWNEFVEPFQLAEFDALACGRLAHHWETVEDEYGDEQLKQGDSKFAAGGSANFGYDCILELEMRRRKRRLMTLIRGRLTVEYICDVIKDANGILNAKQFVFADFGETGYRKGDYKKVLDCFRPHIEFRRQLPRTQMNDRRTSDLLIRGKSQWALDQNERKGLLEEIDANLGMCFPAGEGKSRLAKMCRDLALEFLNGFVSWSRMENEASTPHLRHNSEIVKAIRQRVEQGEIPTDQKSLNVLLNLATTDVLHPEQPRMTLFEAMGVESIELATSKGRKPKPGGKPIELAGD